MESYDVIVLGGASAGLTAALYTSRQGLKTLVLTKDIGGQALLTNDIQNYPGFTEIGGFELTNKFKEQAESFGTEFVYEEVIGIEESEQDCMAVRTRNTTYTACGIILAFGKTPRELGVPGEEEFKGKGVSYCAVCDGPLFKGKSVAVVGAGEPALEAANYLSGVTGKVSVVQRTARPIGSEELINQLTNKESVEFVSNSLVKEIVGQEKVTSLSLENTQTKEKSKIELDGVFIEAGYVARTDFVKDVVTLNGRKEIVTDKEGRTSHPGVFAAGDVTDIPFKQVVVSAGQGCAAALSAYNHVQSIRGKPAVLTDWKAISPKA